MRIFLNAKTIAPQIKNNFDASCRSVFCDEDCTTTRLVSSGTLRIITVTRPRPERMLAVRGADKTGAVGGVEQPFGRGNMAGTCR